MIAIEELDALDLLIWLGRGADAAARLGCNQSTVSRRSNQCLAVFDLRLHRDGEGELCTRQHDLLQLEREVHQLYRLRCGRHLRLDASLLAAPLLRPPLPGSWLQGHLDGLGWRRPLRLIRERILDGWLTAMGQELQADSLRELTVVPLLHTPLLLAARGGHPLLGQGTLQPGDVVGMPRLAPRQGRYPRTETLLGSWRQQTAPVPLDPAARRRDREGARVLERSNPLLLQYGTAFSLARQRWLNPLPLALGVETELSLVMRRDVGEHAAMQLLLEQLQRRALEAVLADQGTPGLN